MKKVKNILLLSGVCLYTVKALWDIFTRVIYRKMRSIEPMFDIQTFLLLFSVILCMAMPTILLILNLKNKYKKSYSIIVLICCLMSLLIVAVQFSPIITYLIISKIGLVDWTHIIIAILPKYGVISLISFILITSGVIMSCKRTKE